MTPPESVFRKKKKRRKINTLLAALRTQKRFERSTIAGRSSIFCASRGTAGTIIPPPIGRPGSTAEKKKKKRRRKNRRKNDGRKVRTRSARPKTARTAGAYFTRLFLEARVACGSSLLATGRFRIFRRCSFSPSGRKPPAGTVSRRLRFSVRFRHPSGRGRFFHCATTTAIRACSRDISGGVTTGRREKFPENCRIAFGPITDRATLVTYEMKWLCIVRSFVVMREIFRL